jgi:SAM-dependent methyltransferase
MVLIKKIYNSLHKSLHNHLDRLPFLAKTYQNKPILKGHISGKHLENPLLDDDLVEKLKQSGIKVEDFWINTEGYHRYISEANYPTSYYGGGLDPLQNFIEKTLEHYVSLSFLPLHEGATFMDIAAATSPFSGIIRSKYRVSKSYKQDLIFPKGLENDRVGGDASHIPLPDASIDGATLHCSLEHFEGTSDTQFFQEIARILKPNGCVVVLPFYLASEYTNHVDPIFNFLRRHKVQLDDDPRVQLRYASWKQFFSRHYDAHALHNRILSNVKGLELTVYRVKNFKEVDKSCYLRFIGVFRKVG